MSRKTPARRAEAANLILNGVGQRDIERITGISRPYLRRLAKELGHQFPRNGIENRGTLCICKHCGIYFFRPKSKIDRAEKNYCSTTCKRFDQYGEGNPNWDLGQSIRTFSSWVVGQKEYKDWREKVMERGGYICCISGRSTELEAHHLARKAETMSPELAFDPDNGIILNTQVHDRIHSLNSMGLTAEEAFDQVLREFATEREINSQKNDNINSPKEQLDDIDGLN